MIITTVQRNIICKLALKGRLTHPRGTLERLHKKCLVEGDRHEGWRLSLRGLQWLADTEEEE